MFLRGPLFSPLKAQNKETIQSWPFSICGACVVSCFSHVWLCDPMDDSPPGFSVHGISPNKNTGVGCHALLQRIFPTQGLNPCLLHLLHGQVDSLPLTPPGNSSALKSDARKCTIFCCSITLLSLFWIPHSLSSGLQSSGSAGFLSLRYCPSMWASAETASVGCSLWSAVCTGHCHTLPNNIILFLLRPVTLLLRYPARYLGLYLSGSDLFCLTVQGVIEIDQESLLHKWN